MGRSRDVLRVEKRVVYAQASVTNANNVKRAAGRDEDGEEALRHFFHFRKADIRVGGAESEENVSGLSSGEEEMLH